ncbi:Yip1 family protein [Methanolacinia paynteri]|uniref:Yip1 family protein n=1 Tax=Methanolacinia paynteri TaxID=230356 RepID=UPI000A022F04|nr:Yip1 family protein [Methanolacinia paynteri]
MIDRIIIRITEVLLDPVESFQQSENDGPKEVLTYFAVLFIINSVLFTIVKYIGIDAETIALIPGSENIFFIFAFAVISSLVQTVIFVMLLHFWAYILGGKGGGMQTIKAFVYASTPMLLFDWIPVIGFIFIIWSAVLNVLGIRELHKMSTEGAAGAFVAAIIISVGLFIFLIGALVIPLIGTTNVT